MKEYEPKYKRLTMEEGKAFIQKNKDKLEGNGFMDYMDYYNKDMMNCRDVCDKNWGKRIVLRHCVYDDYCELNTLYEDWL